MARQQVVAHAKEARDEAEDFGSVACLAPTSLISRSPITATRTPGCWMDGDVLTTSRRQKALTRSIDRSVDQRDCWSSAAPEAAIKQIRGLRS